MAVNKELKKAIEEIKLKFNLRQSDISEKLGVKGPYLSDMINGRVPYSSNIEEKIYELFQMTPEQALPTKTERPRHRKTIRYFDIDASAGPIEMFDPGNGTVYNEVVIPGFGDCEIALNVWGDSMEPTLNSGEIILCKEWSESFIDYGHIYLVVTKKNNRMIKIIQPGNNPETVSCESENTFYRPYEVNRDDIHKLFQIKGHIQRNEI